MEATEDKNPIIIDEVVNLDLETTENQVERAEFAFVVFHNLAETYPEDADLRFQYTLTPDLVPTTRDWVGLYKVGWMSPRDYLYYEWAPVPENYKVGCTADASVVFPATKLPKEDGEFYQLCYVSSSSQIRGASTPFQFRRPGGGEEYVEVEDDETNMLVIRSKTAFLEENLQRAETQKIKLTESLEHVQRERDEVVGKHRELMKVLAAREAANSELGTRLTASEAQLSNTRREARDMILVRDELQLKIDKMKQEHANLENTIGEFTTKLTKMAARMKALEAERDELAGRNTNLEDQVNMYKKHFETSESTVKTYSSQSEEMQIKLAQQESLIEHLKQTVENLTRELEDNRRNLEHQTAANRDSLADLEEKLKNAEDKLSAAEGSKAILTKEIATYQETQQELSRQIEKSRGECDSVKQKLCVLEEDFTQKNKILEMEMDQTRTDLVFAIQEKEKLQGENSGLSQQLSTTPEAMTVMKQTLRQIKDRLEKKEKHCKSLEKSLMGREHEFLQSERDMRREIEDLKEKIIMCSEEYKALYIEKNKLQRKYDKIAKKKGRQDRMSESMVELEATQMTSTPAGSETPQEEEADNTLEPLKQEIDRQVEDLEREMEEGLTKKLKYKNLYRRERETNTRLTETHAATMADKNAEIRRLKQRLMEIPSEYDLKMRALEKCVAEKLQEIELLNQKLRQYNQSRNDEAGASTVPPTKYSGMSSESKYPSYALYGSSYPQHEHSRNIPPIYNHWGLVYPQQVPLQYPHPPAESPIAAPYPLQMPLPPLQYPAHSSSTRTQLSDRSPIQRTQSQTMTYDLQEGQDGADILDSTERETEDLEQPLTPLPPPLEPEVLPSAKVAVVKLSIGKDDVDGANHFMSETNLKVVLPNEPVTAPSAPPTGYEKEDRFYDAEGPAMKHCTYCQLTFGVDVDEQTFEEHVLSHIVGAICPICKTTKHDNMSDDDFQQHVNRCMDKDKHNDVV